MARQPEPTVPDTEALYHSLSVDDVVGGVIQPHAVEIPACSFNRAAYSRPEDVFVASRPEDTGIAEITGAELPPKIPRQGAASFIFVVVDAPEITNDAHCEIQLHRDGLGFDENQPKSKVIKQQAKTALANKLRLKLAPT